MVLLSITGGILFARPYHGREIGRWVVGPATITATEQLLCERIMTMTGRSPRGFAAMDREKQRAIASKGGRAAHAKGTAHEFTTEEARAAGRKGGQAAHAKGTAHEFTPDEAREAGRKGGQSSHGGAGSSNPDQERSISQTELIPSTAPSGTSEITSEPELVGI
jgi:general stress protein YciG